MTHVLVADDNDAIRTSIRFLLEDDGYEVYEAADGRSAMALIATHPERLVVLLDLAMPGMDGMTVLETLRQLPTLAARHAVVVVTAYADAPMPPRLLELTAALGAPMVAKPFHTDDLLAAVRQAELRLRPMPPHEPPPGLFP
jgi:CheY-like chemotaxis protein